MGYYLIFSGLELKNDARMSGALDEDVYDESLAVTIRIPMALPYQYDNPHFVRVQGKFVHGGESYRLIKQKYERDTLTVICIKDAHDKSIQQALSEVVNTFTDSPTDSEAPVAKGAGLFIKEYLLSEIAVGEWACGWMQKLNHTVVQQMIGQKHTTSPLQPPEA
jgi:hypothetical protein